MNNELPWWPGERGFPKVLYWAARNICAGGKDVIRGGTTWWDDEPYLLLVQLGHC